MTDLPERLEKWAEDPTVFLSFRETDLLYEAADAVRNLSAEVETLRAERAGQINTISRGMAEARETARLAGRAGALEESAFACDETAREYLWRADSSTPGMSIEREWRLCAEAARICAEAIRQLNFEPQPAAE